MFHKTFLLFLQRKLFFMNARIIIFTSAVFLLFALEGCRKGSNLTGNKTTENTIRIKGVLEGGQGQILIIEEMGAREFIPLDTVTCDDSGAFEISFSPEESSNTRTEFNACILPALSSVVTVIRPTSAVARISNGIFTD